MILRRLLPLVLLGLLATPAAAPAQTAPRKGGEVVLSMFEDADKLDPTFGGTAGGREIFFNMCEPLYDLTADGSIVPRLAAALPQFSRDGKEATIPIRKGLLFNDGTPLDAQAVKISLDRHRTLAGSRRAAELSAVTQVTVVDPSTVRLGLARPLAPLVATLSDRSGMIMSPAQLQKLGENFATQPVCVGPFAFVERVPGDRIVLERSKHYYDAAQVLLDRVVFKPIPDENVRSLNLRSGDLQVVDRLAASEVPAVERDQRLKLLTVTSNGYLALYVNISNTEGAGKPPGQVDSPLARHPGLREALELSLDRDQINRLVFNGRQVPACNPIAPVNGFYPKAFKCPPPDLTRAKELVARSGVATPITVEFTVHNSPVMIRLGEMVQSMAKQAGFNLVVRPVEAVTSLNANTAGKFQLGQNPWSGRVDPDGNLYPFHHTTGSDNYGNAQDPEIDALLDRQRAETNLESRQKLIAEIIEKTRARRSIIYLFHQNLFVAHTARLTGLQVYADGMPRLKTAGLLPQ